MQQEEISGALQIASTTDLGMYLDMPTLTSGITKDTFKHICEKIDRRLGGWKTEYLSLAGRITLAKSTLTTIANYSMQTAKLPRSLCDDVDKRVRKFVWGGGLWKPSRHSPALMGDITKNKTSRRPCVACCS